MLDPCEVQERPASLAVSRLAARGVRTRWKQCANSLLPLAPSLAILPAGRKLQFF
jgi:hypothetical protein